MLSCTLTGSVTQHTLCMARDFVLIPYRLEWNENQWNIHVIAVFESRKQNTAVVRKRRGEGWRWGGCVSK